MGTRTYSRRGVLTRLGRERAERQGAPAGVAAQRPSGVELEREMYDKTPRELQGIGREAESANDFDRAYAAFSEMANKRINTLPGSDDSGTSLIYEEQTPRQALQNVAKALSKSFNKFKALDLENVPMKEAAKVAQFFAEDLVNIIKRAQADIDIADRRADRGEDTDTIYSDIAERFAYAFVDSSNEEINQTLGEINRVLSEASDYFQAGADSGFINPY